MERLKAPSHIRYALELFSSDAYLTINKKLLQHYGPNIAVFLSNLVDKYKYFKEKGLLEDDRFFQTHKQQMEWTGLTIEKLRSCKVLLIKDGVLDSLMKGLPPKEWFYIDFDKLMTIIYPTNIRRKTRRLIIGKHDEYKDNKFKDNKNYIKSFDKKTIPPTIDMVKEYCKERRNKINPETFIDFYTMKDWMVGKTRMKDWQAAVRTWEKNHQNGNNRPKYASSDEDDYDDKPLPDHIKKLYDKR
jgi:hypothetical protein